MVYESGDISRNDVSELSVLNINEEIWTFGGYFSNNIGNGLSSRCYRLAFGVK